jgi:predicted O-methyltransferase YrrM
MVIGDRNNCRWPYLRREIPHNWYVDSRAPTIGFASRDEAHILYNIALLFQNQMALEIGCWLGWTACHLALGGVKLDVIDPILARDEFRKSVNHSLAAAGVLEHVHLVAGASPLAISEIAGAKSRKWALIFIDGDHNHPGPIQDAVACEALAEQNAMVVFHDLISPDVARGLEFYRAMGWKTRIYQTMQIMGIAYRGSISPPQHYPDPAVNWVMPEHLLHHV